MFSSSAKPYSAVTVQIERLTKEEYEVDDLGGIIDLIEVIKLQSSGPTEAARAIRKKLKYGDVHRQLRALTILDGLMQNAGSRFQKAFADEPLLERLRVAATDTLSDDEVKQKCQVLFRQWAVAYKSTPGMERIAALYKQLPQRKKPAVKERARVLRETENDDPFEEESERPGHRTSVSAGSGPSLSLRSPTSPTSAKALSQNSHLFPPASNAFSPTGLSHSKQKADKKKSKSKTKPFNLDKEKPVILQSIAESSVATTSLMNALRLINRENKRVSEDREANQGFEKCRNLRRTVIRFIPFMEGGDLLGALLHANDELVDALTAYYVLDKSIDDDSDSEIELDDAGASAAKRRSLGQQMAGLSLAAPIQPPRPGSIPMPPANGKGRLDDEAEEEEEEEEDDEDDPFADRNAVSTPKMEKGGMTWRDV